MPAYGEKQKPAGRKKTIIPRNIPHRGLGRMVQPPYKGNAVHNAQK